MDSNRTETSLETTLEQWGSSTAQQPAPPMPPRLRTAVRERRSSQSRTAFIRAAIYTAAAAAIAVAMTISMRPAPGPAADPPGIILVTPLETEVPATPTFLALSRANASFDPSDVRLPEDEQLTAPEAPYTLRDTAHFLKS